MGKNEGKRKWERDYEKYSSSTELDDRLEYLTNLTEGKVAMKEEYSELKKLTAIKENLPKVKNVLELRGKLEEEAGAIKKEILRRQLADRYVKATEILEDQMQKLQEEKTSLEEEMNKPDLKPEKKAELQSKLAENSKKIQENNIKFGKCHEEIKKENAEQSEFKDVSTSDLESQSLSLSQEISMCNYVGNRLMQGYSMKSIEKSLDKFQGQKLTAKGKEAEKMKKNREAAKADPIKEQEGQEQEAQEQEGQEQEAQEQEGQEQEQALVELSRWQKAKLWLAGIGSKAVSGVKKFFEKFKKEEKEEIEEIEEKEEIKEQPDLQPSKEYPWEKMYGEYKKDEKGKSEDDKAKDEDDKGKENGEKQPSKQNDFRKYLVEIAEKGMDGVEKENKEARRQAAIEKLKANRAGKDTGAIITNLDKQINEQDNDAR